MRHALAVIATLPFLSATAWGWGCEGHQMVALIARAHLTPAASSAVDQLLGESPIDASLSRYCKDRPADPMADSATWADDSRNIEKTGDWHFIDIPIAIPADRAHEPELMKWCPPAAGGKAGCIVSAIDYEWGILRDQTKPAAERARALRYVIHFVGDLTQPLHASDNHDRGGNCTAIRWPGQEKAENLHTIWDSKILAAELEDKKTSQVAYAKTLDEAFAGDWKAWGQAKPDVAAWTWDSHRLAISVTYGDLKPRIPVASVAAGLADQDACTAGRAEVAALHVAVDDGYIKDAMPVIREQLAKAGYRLAGLLNETLK